MSEPTPQPDTLWLMIPVWKRPELTAVVLDYYRHLARALYRDGLSLKVLVVDSPEDPCDVPVMFPFHAVTTANRPLGTKLNTGAQWIHARQPLGMMTIGSDDFVTIDYFRAVFAALRAGMDIVALERCSFLDLANWRAVHWEGEWTRTNMPSGVGRTMSGRLLAKLKGIPWHRSNDRGLDTSNWQYLFRHNEAYPELTHIIQNDDKHAALDVKTSENIWTFDKFERTLVGKSPGRLVDAPDSWVRDTFGWGVETALRGLR